MASIAKPITSNKRSVLRSQCIALTKVDPKPKYPVPCWHEENFTGERHSQLA
jgi:hypothetical protein